MQFNGAQHRLTHSGSEMTEEFILAYSLLSSRYALCFALGAISGVAFATWWLKGKIR